MKRSAVCIAVLIPCLAVACGNGDDNGAAPSPDASVAEVGDNAPDGGSVVVIDAQADGLAPEAGTLTDGEIVGVVLAANTGEIEAAELAVGAGGAVDAGAPADAGFDAGAARTSTPAVLMFADMMIQMHSMSNTAAQALGVVGQPSAVQSDLDANGKTTLSQLAPLSGAAFDLAYMQAQVMAHMTVKTIIETQLIPSATNADLKNFLQSTLLPTVEAHLSGATALLASLEDGGLPDARADGSADASADASDASAE